MRDACCESNDNDEYEYENEHEKKTDQGSQMKKPAKWGILSEISSNKARGGI